jgi:hypothetical protein
MTSEIKIINIESHIFEIRGKRVMIDSDLANLYEVETKVLNQAVKRNLARFPEDFMFQLTNEEDEILRSQIVTSSWGGRRTLPFAFTEQGIAMLSSVLNSDRAILVNIQIMRAFVKLREMIISHKDLAAKIADMEKKYDKQFKIVFDAINKLITVEIKPKRKIGFNGKEK